MWLQQDHSFNGESNWRDNRGHINTDCLHQEKGFHSISLCIIIFRSFHSHPEQSCEVGGPLLEVAVGMFPQWGVEEPGTKTHERRTAIFHLCQLVQYHLHLFCDWRDIHCHCAVGCKLEMKRQKNNQHWHSKTKRQKNNQHQHHETKKWKNRQRDGKRISINIVKQRDGKTNIDRQRDGKTISINTVRQRDRKTISINIMRQRNGKTDKEMEKESVLTSWDKEMEKQTSTDKEMEKQSALTLWDKQMEKQSASHHEIKRQKNRDGKQTKRWKNNQH